MALAAAKDNGLAASRGQKAAEPRGFGIMRSLISKLILLLVVFCAVPIMLYGEFKQADEEKQNLLLEAVREQGRLIAETLRPLLMREDPSPLLDVQAVVSRLATPHTGVKVLFLPAGEHGVEGFYYVASEPEVPPATLQLERDRLVERGVLDNLVGTCAGEVPIALRHRNPQGDEELLTSIIPITTKAGCWAVITAHAGGAFLGTSIGQPYWQTLEVRIAIIIYLTMAVLTIGVFLTIWRSLMRFRNTARQVRTGTAPPGSFARQNAVPELAVVAQEFDRMTRSLQDSAEDIRRAAEDNAHAFKTPIAIMRQSLEPLQRIVPGDSARGRRALDVIEESIDRLDHLVTCARQLEETTAELLDPPRHEVNLSRLIERMLGAYDEAFANRGLHFQANIKSNVVVRAGEDLIETVIENLIDNAMGVSPPGGAIAVHLSTSSGNALLVVRDHGPGVPENQLERIFERYVSLRGQAAQDGAGQDGAGQDGTSQDGAQAKSEIKPPPVPVAGTPESQHLGIGLWIVRRNLEAVGGGVRAENAPGGGLAVVIWLPLAS